MAPLTVNQRGFLAVERLKRSSSNVGWLVPVPTDAHLMALQEAVWSMIARHEALRTVLQDGGASQSAWTDFRPHIHEVFVANKSEIRDVIIAAQHRTFPLFDRPLFDASVIRAPDACVIAIVASHIVVDGRSMELVSEDIRAALSEPTVDRPPPRGFLEYAEAEPGYLAAAADAETYFRDVLRSTGNGRAHVVAPPTREAIELSARFDNDNNEAIERVCRRHRVTPFMLSAWALGRALAELSGGATSPVWTTIEHRGRDFDGSVGQFANAIPLQVEGSPSDVRLALLRALRHGRLPTSRILRSAGITIRDTRTIPRDGRRDRAGPANCPTSEVRRRPATERLPLAVPHVPSPSRRCRRMDVLSDKLGRHRARRPRSLDDGYRDRRLRVICCSPGSPEVVSRTSDTRDGTIRQCCTEAKLAATGLSRTVGEGLALAWELPARVLSKQSPTEPIDWRGRHCGASAGDVSALWSSGHDLGRFLSACETANQRDEHQLRTEWLAPLTDRQSGSWNASITRRRDRASRPASADG